MEEQNTKPAEQVSVSKRIDDLWIHVSRLKDIQTEHNKEIIQLKNKLATWLNPRSR